jgi:hypothetical protein
MAPSVPGVACQTPSCQLAGCHWPLGHWQNQAGAGTLGLAAKAIRHVLLQIRTNEDVRYHLGYGTESFSLLTQAAGKIDNQPLEKVQRWALNQTEPSTRS